MKRSLLAAIFLLLFFSSAHAQQIVYSDYNKEDNREINFEILGKQGGNYIIYKNVRWKHMLAFYDENMRMTKDFRMTYIPEKTFNIDFITYPDHFYIIYQYQKNNTIYCNAVKLDNSGNKLLGPVLLDTTRVWPRQGQKIYTTKFSENKKHILMYKMVPFSNKMHLLNKIYDDKMDLKDSIRTVYEYDDRRDVFSDIVIDNDGTIVYGMGETPKRRSNIQSVELVTKAIGKDESVVNIPLQNRFIDEFRLKVDNKNRQYIINSFFYPEATGDIQGLFMCVINMGSIYPKTAFYAFADSLQKKMATTSARGAYNNLFMRNVIVTRDGGFLVAAENAYSVSSGGLPYNRYNYLGTPGLYPSIYDYNLMSSNFNSYYRPYYHNNYFQNTRYHYDDILLFSVSNDLTVDWNNVIPKKQVDEGDDNFMSFAIVNTGGEIQFLFLEKERNLQLISNHAVTPSGFIKRYATLKSREAGYEFMPKLAKQVAATKVIIPCLYRGNICFALVDFAS